MVATRGTSHSETTTVNRRPTVTPQGQPRPTSQSLSLGGSAHGNVPALRPGTPLQQGHNLSGMVGARGNVDSSVPRQVARFLDRNLPGQSNSNGLPERLRQGVEDQQHQVFQGAHDMQEVCRSVPSNVVGGAVEGAIRGFGSIARTFGFDDTTINRFGQESGEQARQLTRSAMDAPFVVAEGVSAGLGHVLNAGADWAHDRINLGAEANQTLHDQEGAVEGETLDSMGMHGFAQFARNFNHFEGEAENVVGRAVLHSAVSAVDGVGHLATNIPGEIAEAAHDPMHTVESLATVAQHPVEQIGGLVGHMYSEHGAIYTAANLIPGLLVGGEGVAAEVGILPHAAEEAAEAGTMGRVREFANETREQGQSANGITAANAREQERGTSDLQEWFDGLVRHDEEVRRETRETHGDWVDHVFG